MIRSEKKYKELAFILEKKNTAQIVQAIKSLRKEEPFEGAIGLLVSLFNETSDRMLLKTIEEFFNDLKDQSVRTEIIAELRKSWNLKTINMLVSSSWQSGLDYSDYIEDMANIFLTGDYATGIDCMTVIEASVPDVSRERKDEIIGIIRESPSAWVNEKNYLTRELISILEK